MFSINYKQPQTSLDSVHEYEIIPLSIDMLITRNNQPRKLMLRSFPTIDPRPLPTRVSQHFSRHSNYRDSSINALKSIVFPIWCSCLGCFYTGFVCIEQTFRSQPIQFSTRSKIDEERIFNEKFFNQENGKAKCKYLSNVKPIPPFSRSRIRRRLDRTREIAQDSRERETGKKEK